MTVSSTTSKQTFACDGTTTIFTCPFRVLAAADMRGYLITISTQASSELSNGVDFVVSAVGDANALVTTTAAYSSLYQIKFVRDTARLQLTDYRDNDPFPAEAHEEALDRLTHIAQEQDSSLSRAVTLPEPESGAELPSATSRAGKLFGFAPTTGAPEASAFTQAQVAAAISALAPNGTYGTVILREKHIATASQTVFTLANSYTPGTNSLVVVVDGDVLPPVVDYAETNTTTVTFGTGLVVGQEVEFIVGRLVTSGISSDQVSWQNARANAVARTQTAKNFDTISVKDFGATGDGATDDTTFILNAIAAATGTITGYRIHFPRGVYKISATLDVADKANMYLVGDGPNATVIKPTTSVTTAVKFGTSGTSNQGISDMHILCEDATACVGVSVTGCDGFWYSDMRTTAASIGLSLAPGFGQFFDRFRIDDSITAGIKIAGGNDQFFSNGVLLNPVGAQPSTAGIWVTKNDAFWLHNVDAIYQKHGLLLAPQGTDYISWVFASNCAFDYGSGNGILIAPAASATVKGVNFVGCWTSSNTLHGITADGAGTVDGLRFTGHRSYRNTGSGYYLTNTGTVINTAFVSCEASGNSFGSSGVYSGFDIAANIGAFSIVGCRSGPMSGLSDTQARGILVNPGTSDNYVIVGNDLRGNTTGLVEGGSGTTKHVAHNLNAVTSATGSSTVAVGASTRVITHGLIGTPTLQEVVITDGSGRAASGITDVWVSALGATTFQVNTNTNVTTTAFTFGWSARIKGA